MKSMRLVTDSAGAGRFRGGPAGEVIYGPLRDPMMVAYFAEMNVEPAQGANGGLPGSRSLAARIDAAGNEQPLPPIGLVELAPGEWIRGLESGGGGYGDPFARDPQRVLHDVLEGWVSELAARETYGVILVTSGVEPTVTLDLPATQRFRLERKAGKP
jgi:N-methylhydantoinase B